MVVSRELTHIFNYRWNVTLVFNIGWHCLLLLFIALLNMGLVRLSRRCSVVASIFYVYMPVVNTTSVSLSHLTD
jgi:hypothetical protein